MNNAPLILRSLIVYAVCVPLAVFVGYSITDPFDRSSLGFMGVLGFVLVFPLLLRWHYPLLLFLWGSSITLNFLHGSPSGWWCIVVLSLGISIVERILSRDMHFIRVPQVTWPLIAMFAVVVITAELTGGIGLKALGSSVYGGKKYVVLFISIFSYFALTSRRIPLEKANLYVALFYLGHATVAIGDFYPVTPSGLRFIYYIFPPTSIADNPLEVGVTRLSGVSSAAMSVYLWLMARYGIRGIFMGGKLWRPVLFTVLFVLIFFGGFRSMLISFAAVFILMFFLEGLHRTQLLLVFGLAGVLACVAVVPLASKLPFTFQRTLAFLPLDLSQDAVNAADATIDWRVNMWKALLPEVPSHLLLGKGFAFSQEEYNTMMTGGAMARADAMFDAAQTPLALSGDYHNAMLSVILPFGIWGVLATFWLMWAGLKVLYRNWKYGDPALQTINLFLFVTFIWEVAQFASCISAVALSGELANLIGALGFSIALNNGACAPPAQIRPATQVNRSPKIFPHLRPALPR